MATSALNNNLFAAAVRLTTPTQPQRNTQTRAAASVRATASDTVALSGKAQATLLHQQGLSVQEIATSLELTTAEINSYLGIITTTGGGGTGAAHAVTKNTAQQNNSATTDTSKPLAKTAAGSLA